MLILVHSINAQTYRLVPGNYPTISAAVSSSNPGDIIKISAGTYSEQIVIDKDLTIVGAGNNSTLIQEDGFSSADSTIIFINSAIVTLRDLQINGVPNNEGRRRGIVSLNSALTLRQCNFVMISNAAVAVVNGSVDADSILITCINSGTSTAIADSGQYGNGIGIALDNGFMLMNAHFNISHLTAGGSINHIIDIYPNSNGYVLTRKYPVDLAQFTQGTIENSTLYGELDFAYGQAIRVFGDLSRPEGAPQLVIRNNRMKGHAVDSSLVIPNRLDCAGISFSGANGYAEIYGNTIEYFNSGISMYGYSTASIHNNIIRNNARYGVVTSWGGGAYAGEVDLGGGTYSSAGKNIIKDNGKYDVMNKSTLQIWALHNDWGTIDLSAIATKIYDQSDNAASGIVHYDINTFPVELRNLSASVAGVSVLLKWETATEKNNYGFYIERSESGVWKNLGFVLGNGISFSPKIYSFRDDFAVPGENIYRIKQVDNDGKQKYYGPLSIFVSAPACYQLMQNSPNPFNPGTEIKFTLPEISNVKIFIYDQNGSEVTILSDDTFPAGTHSVYWDGRNIQGNSVSSGIYFYRLSAGRFSETRKMMLIR